MTDPSVGLTAHEARRRLDTGGQNAVVDVAQHPLRRAANKLWAPIPWMLEAAILLQLGLGDYVERRSRKAEEPFSAYSRTRSDRSFFLTAGLVIIGHAILTPMLMVLMMVTGDFLAMSSSTDNVRPSPKPNRWRIHNLTIAGVIMGMVDLLFCVACLVIGKYVIGLDTESLRTLTVITLVFSGQALFYVAREREHLWSYLPGRWLVMSSIVDIAIISLLAANGFAMAAIPIGILVGVFGAAVIFAFVLDAVKSVLFHRLAVV